MRNSARAMFPLMSAPTLHLLPRAARLFHTILLLTVLLWLANPAEAQEREGQPAGDFDYYVLALSWSPNWCARQGDARDAAQCEGGAGLGFTLHGLWPQYERGWPSYCRTAHRDPPRRLSATMADIMGSSGLAWHQWQKHGRCSGLPAETYFDASRRAYESLTIPEVFRALRRDVTLPASVVEEAFIEANPGLGPEMITVTCAAGMIAEARICLTRDLAPRACAADVARDCALRDAHMEGLR